MKHITKIKQEGVEGVSNKKRLPKVLSKNQLMKLVSVADDSRLFVIVHMGIFFGLRIGETAKLQWRDIDFDGKTIFVRDGKNTKRHMSDYGKDRNVTVMDEFIPFLKMWRSLNKEEKYVLPHPKFKERDLHNSKGSRGMRKFCQDLLKNTLKKAELLEVDYYQRNGKPRYTFHTHTLRHVAGCNMVRMGVHIEQIRRQLGHEDITDTQIYFQLVPEDTREELGKCMDNHVKNTRTQTPQRVAEDLIRIQQEKIRLLELELTEKEIKARLQNGYLSQQTIRT